jgi:hypothetical protein
MNEVAHYFYHAWAYAWNSMLKHVLPCQWKMYCTPGDGFLFLEILGFDSERSQEG